MTHLNFAVEQHGGIYILLSGNVSTFFSSSNIEKILNTLFQNTFAHMHARTHTQIGYTFPGNKHLLLNAVVLNCSLSFVLFFFCFKQQRSLPMFAQLNLGPQRRSRGVLISKVESSEPNVRWPWAPALHDYHQYIWELLLKHYCEYTCNQDGVFILTESLLCIHMPLKFCSYLITTNSFIKEMKSIYYKSSSQKVLKTEAANRQAGKLLTSHY